MCMPARPRVTQGQNSFPDWKRDGRPRVLLETGGAKKRLKVPVSGNLPPISVLLTDNGGMEKCMSYQTLVIRTRLTILAGLARVMPCSGVSKMTAVAAPCGHGS